MRHMVEKEHSNGYNLQIVSRPRIGARLSKIYAFNKTGTVWSHSDADGLFYVFKVDDSSYNVSLTNVTASQAFKSVLFR